MLTARWSVAAPAWAAGAGVLDGWVKTAALSLAAGAGTLACLGRRFERVTAAATTVMFSQAGAHELFVESGNARRVARDGEREAARAAASPKH